MANDNKKYIPTLRFPEFQNDGEWTTKLIKDIANTFSGGTPTVGNSNYYGGGIPFIRSGEIAKSATDLFITELGLSASSAKMVEEGTILYALYGATSGEVAISKIRGAINQAVLAIIPKSRKYVVNYIYYFLKHQKAQILSKYLQGGQGNLSGAIIDNLSIVFPCDCNGNISAVGQKKIADCFVSIDKEIDATKRKLEQLKEHKKGLMQKLFPAKGKTIPELRFPEFQNEGEWIPRPLSDIFNYEQPTSYIVENDTYKKEGTPVLTANKGFILGYTDESLGIYNKLPVIIFDDFTTDKKYVDFPFKIKSSAIKLLSLKDEERDNLRFVFECMNNIVFEEKEHKRYYISEYQHINICVPSSLQEQNQIADTLLSVDKQISEYDKKIKALELHKKGLMQQLFPKL